MKKHTCQSHPQPWADSVFEDPVSYLRGLGLEAVVVGTTPAPLPQAA